MPILAKKPIFDLGLNTPREHFNQLHHGTQHGEVIVWERATGTGGSGRWHKMAPGDPHIPALLAAQQGQKDRYLSVNEFFGWRLVRLLKSLRACYVDIDRFTDFYFVLERLKDFGIPPPSAVVFSGRGLHLYWIHDAVPAQALPVWQRVQDALIAALKPLGADVVAKDCTRVLRIAGSINSKNGEEVRGLVLDPVPWEFRHLCNEVLGYRESKPKRQVFDLTAELVRRGERTRTGSIYDRWHLVYRDLLEIGRWYDIGGVPNGYRDTWLFLSAVSLSWFANPASLKDELERQAKIWTPGLKIGEIRNALRCPLERAELAAQGIKFEWQGKEVDPRYRFRRETLWNMMEPIIDPELAPQLRAIVSAETKAEHHAESKRLHEATRDRVAEGRYKTRRAESMEQQKPWEALGISRRTYYRRKGETA